MNSEAFHQTRTAPIKKKVPKRLGAEKSKSQQKVLRIFLWDLANNGTKLEIFGRVRHDIFSQHATQHTQGN